MHDTDTSARAWQEALASLHLAEDRLGAVNLPPPAARHAATSNDRIR